MGQKNTPSTEGGQLRKSDPSLPSHLGIFPGEQKVLLSPNKELEENLYLIR